MKNDNFDISVDKTEEETDNLSGIKKINGDKINLLRELHNITNEYIIKTKDINEYNLKDFNEKNDNEIDDNGEEIGEEMGEEMGEIKNNDKDTSDDTIAEKIKKCIPWLIFLIAVISGIIIYKKEKNFNLSYIILGTGSLISLVLK